MDFTSNTPAPHTRVRWTFMSAGPKRLRPRTADEAISGLAGSIPALYRWHPAKIADLVDPDRFPCRGAGAAGQYTYHGPGQPWPYVMLDVGNAGRDVRPFSYKS